FNYHKADLGGVGLSTGSKHYFVSSELAVGSPSLKDHLSNPSYKKSVYDYKAMKVFLKWKGLTLEGVDFDLLLAAYIVKSSIGKEDFTAVAQLFDINDLAYDEEIYGK